MAGINPTHLAVKASVGVVGKMISAPNLTIAATAVGLLGRESDILRAGAAEVLADALGVPTENTAKWITEHRRLPERRQEIESYAAQLARAYPSPATRTLQKQAAASRAAYARFSLRPGQLVIVDEASMAATMDLD